MFSMDSSATTFKPKDNLQNPNDKLHSITSKKSSKVRRRELKRQSKLLSNLERDFQSILSFSPTIEFAPKSTRDPDPKLEVQCRCSIKCHEFLLNESFDREVGEGESYEFFRGLFEKDEVLRGIYMNDSANGTFLCLVCGEEKNWKMYDNCTRLVQHACTVEKTKEIWAHRAFGRVVCEVLGWDVNEYFNLSNSNVGNKLMKSTKVMKEKLSFIRIRSTKSCNGDVEGSDESKNVEKEQGFNFNAISSATECNTFLSSTSFDGRNSCSKSFNSVTSSQIMCTGRASTSSQIMCTGRTSTSSRLRASEPSIEQCIEKLKSLQRLCPGSELFNFACNLMLSVENREIFMELIDDMARYTWLEYNYNKEVQFMA